MLFCGFFVVVRYNVLVCVFYLCGWFFGGIYRLILVLEVMGCGGLLRGEGLKCEVCVVGDDVIGV